MPQSSGLSKGPRDQSADVDTHGQLSPIDLIAATSTQVLPSLNTPNEAIDGSCKGYGMFNLYRRLKALKGPLKQLNMLHFSHITARAERAKNDLDLLHQQLHDNPWDTQLQIHFAEMKAQSLKLATAKRCFFSQQAKCKYLM
ncbi:hypothetical protein Dimus_030875 [Dionaea muscipula]